MFCWFGKKRGVVFLQQLEEEVKRLYQHGEIDSASVGVLKLSRFPDRILLSIMSWHPWQERKTK